MLSLKKRLISITVALATTLTFAIPVSADEVNVYSARKEALIKPLLDKFTTETGIEVNLVTGGADALISRMSNEGKYSPADVLITTDVGRLVRAKQQGLTQAVDSSVLSHAIPAQLRDKDKHWFSLTMRARPIMYSPERVDADKLSTMEALTQPEWKGRICIRSSSNIYNQSMIASMIQQKGEADTLSWAEGLVKNFARPPKGGDRDQIKAVVSGQCDIAIANTYYLAGMLNSADVTQKKIASQVKVFWPNQNGRGAHINVSGAAVAKHAPNSNNAVKLLEYMVREDAQAWYAETNHEYPVRDGVEWSDTLKQFGTFTAEDITLHRVGELNADAVKVMDKAGWK
ncbi:Fe(3+) ABC transporter substrate-binding protein [Alteromonas sp. ASW11-130]|uniref:Fe(3+) ABC transporter substrate-binding protein n=1 Tax=Alteromonas sp. ASW11-130 TaxID=3015775 RepID=UPI002241C87C|nr:Fe(3+) ABC transporter substrate-binding protein [Alteromonas sp. ASW11-130]MCW8091216.1 Fe(3+) ABC transporter substrate-binding protein [Alteromonas sp. ASW11-130]